MTDDQLTTARAAITIAAEVVGVPPDRITRDVRHPRVSRARYLVAWVLHRRLDWDPVDVSRVLGRSAGTVSDASRQVVHRMRADPDLRRQGDEVVARLKSSAPRTMTGA